MTYVPGFDADIVISFADADNAQGTEALARQVAKKWPDQKHLAERVRDLEQQLAAVASGNVAIEIRGLGKGWVSGFTFVLEEFIEQILGERVDIEFCSESASRDAQARVGKCAVLVSAMSPAYVEESVLRGHIESFLSGLPRIESEVSVGERAFAVEKQPVSSHAAVARYEKARTWELWVEDTATGEARELPSTLSDADVLSEAEERDEREFLKKTYEVARSIAEVLRSMRPVEARELSLSTSEELASEAKLHAERELEEIKEGVEQQIQDQRTDPGRVGAASETEAGPAHRGSGDGQITAPDPAAETSDVMTGTVELVDHGGDPQPEVESRPESDRGKAESDALRTASEPTRYTVYVDYDRRDRRAASAVAGYVKHLSEKGDVGLKLLKPHWRTEVQSDDEKEPPCEHCGRSSPSRRVDEQADIDLGFLKRVRRSHVTLVVFSEAGTEWAEERQAKIIQFETDQRETPGIASVESLARAVYVHLPGQEHKRQRADMRDWTQPYDQFIQLPAKPSDSLQPKELDDFLARLQESEGHL